jgi:hypothetical protein
MNRKKNIPMAQMMQLTSSGPAEPGSRRRCPSLLLYIVVVVIVSFLRRYCTLLSLKTFN